MWLTSEATSARISAAILLPSRIVAAMTPRPPLRFELYRKLSWAKELNRKGREEMPQRSRRFTLRVSSLRPLRSLRLRLLATLPGKKSVKSCHDPSRPARDSGMSGLQEAVGAESRRPEPEVRRVPARLSGARRHSDHAGGRGDYRTFLSRAL